MLKCTENTKVTSRYKISIVIPVLNAAIYLPRLFEAILKQRKVNLQEIILVDSGSSDNTIYIASKYPIVRIIEINNFSHGKARNLGASKTNGDIIVFLTQDALPGHQTWLYNLVAHFEDDEVAAAYSRQVPWDDAIFTERFFLNIRFPEVLPTKRKKSHDEDELTFEKVFFSNVSSAVRRSILMQYPFDEKLIMSEDQQLSRDLLNAGWAVIYASDSVVIHSHNYTLINVFKRYFDSVYSLTQIFPKHNSETSFLMGISYLRKEIIYVIKNHPRKICYYIFYTAAKTAGTLLAHVADHLPLSILKKLSLHKYYWE